MGTLEADGKEVSSDKHIREPAHSHWVCRRIRKREQHRSAQLFRKAFGCIPVPKVDLKEQPRPTERVPDRKSDVPKDQVVKNDHPAGWGDGSEGEGTCQQP